MARQRICGVYAITSPSGGMYIGSSVHCMSRWSGHRADLRNKRHHCSALQNAANKYGVDSLQFFVITESTPEYVRRHEELAFLLYRPEYNSTWNTREPLSGLWKDKEFRKRVSAQAGEQMKRLQQDPEFQKKQRRSAAKALYELHKDEEFAKAHKVRATSRIQGLVNADPAMKEKAAEGRRKRIAEDRKDPAKWEKRFSKLRATKAIRIHCVEAGITFDDYTAAGKWLKDVHGFKSNSHLSNALAGRCEKAYGFTWRRAEEGDE